MKTFSLSVSGITVFLVSAVCVVVLFNSFHTRTFAQAADSRTTDGIGVGTVVWSVLPPEDFRKENGKGWILLAGDDVSDTRLGQDYGFQYLPDARGCFLRALNGIVMPGGEMRNLRENRLEKGDSGGDRRTVGSWQGDTVGKHTHPYRVGDAVRGHDAKTKGGEFFYGGIELTTGENPGAETRPRNIALYCYIKVDNI